MIIKKYLLAVLTTALAVGAVPARAEAAQRQVDGSYIVTFKNSNAVANASKLAVLLGGELGMVYDQLGPMVQMHLPPAAAEALAANPTVAAIEPDQLISVADTQNDPIYNLDRIDEPTRPLDGKYVYPGSAGGGVNIFVLDTGINVAHLEFLGGGPLGLLPRASAPLNANFCFNTPPCTPSIDVEGHGTHVAGTAGGTTVGVAKKANLIAVKVLNDEGSGANSEVIAGLNYVVNRHKNALNKKSVINMSLGGAKSNAVNAAVKAATDAGIHVVAAAGNESSDACQASPASAPSAITVGATVEFSDDIADFSNWGTCLDIFAPGEDIVSASNEDLFSTREDSGTSQAAPHVAGDIALSIARYGNTTPSNMDARISDRATDGVVTGDIHGAPNLMLRVPAP